MIQLAKGSHGGQPTSVCAHHSLGGLLLHWHLKFCGRDYDSVGCDGWPAHEQIDLNEFDFGGIVILWNLELHTHHLISGKLVDF
jgi:hypothetical protein